MKIENMLSQNGNKVANQFKIFIGNNTYYFKSYSSIVAAVNTRTQKVELYGDFNYSSTTFRYLYQFLWELGRSDLSNRKKLQDAIKKGRVNVFHDSPKLF